MIESLSVTNFYCFKERTTISFVAKKERNMLRSFFATKDIVVRSLKQ